MYSAAERSFRAASIELQSAVLIDDLTGDESGQRRGEKPDDMCELLRFAIAMNRYLRDNRASLFLGKLLGHHWGSHICGGDGVDGNAVRGVVRVLADRGIAYNGVVGCEDLTALGIMKELKAIGKRIPLDVAVIAFNNSIFSELAEPSMTSVDNKSETIGVSLSRALVDVLQGRDVPHEASIFPELIIRESA